MILLYDNPVSGNSYKVRLLLAHLGVPFAREEISVVGDRDAQRVDTVAAHNPLAKIPTVVFEDGTSLGESSAILWYFAEGTEYLPDVRLDRARVLSWLTFEQNAHEPFIATARYHKTILKTEPSVELGEIWHRGGHRALGVLAWHLQDHAYLVAERFTIADIALYAYTHLAGAGGFDLEPYPAVRAWLERVRSQPGHVPIEA